MSVDTSDLACKFPKIKKALFASGHHEHVCAYEVIRLFFSFPESGVVPSCPPDDGQSQLYPLWCLERPFPPVRREVVSADLRSLFPLLRLPCEVYSAVAGVLVFEDSKRFGKVEVET